MSDANLLDRQLGAPAALITPDDREALEREFALIEAARRKLAQVEKRPFDFASTHLPVPETK